MPPMRNTSIIDASNPLIDPIKTLIANADSYKNGICIITFDNTRYYRGKISQAIEFLKKFSPSIVMGKEYTIELRREDANHSFIDAGYVGEKSAKNVSKSSVLYLPSKYMINNTKLKKKPAFANFQLRHTK